MASNNISTLATKQAKQIAKLNIAQAKRRGQIVSNTGAISGSANSAQPFARTLNTYDTTRLPTVYSGNVAVDTAGNLVASRPWT
jgi:hypothetical protein